MRRNDTSGFFVARATSDVRRAQFVSNAERRRRRIELKKKKKITKTSARYGALSRAVRGVGGVTRSLARRRRTTGRRRRRRHRRDRARSLAPFRHPLFDSTRREHDSRRCFSAVRTTRDFRLRFGVIALYYRVRRTSPHVCLRLLSLSSSSSSSSSVSISCTRRRVVVVVVVVAGTVRASLCRARNGTRTPSARRSVRRSEPSVRRVIRTPQRRARGGVVAAPNRLRTDSPTGACRRKRPTPGLRSLRTGARLVSSHAY